MLVTRQLGHLSKLIHIIGKLKIQSTCCSIILSSAVCQYFAPLSSVLIVYNGSYKATPLQMDYLEALQLTLSNLSSPIKLQWINTANIPDDDTLEWQILRAVNSSVTEVIVFLNVIPITLMNLVLFFVCRASLQCCHRPRNSSMRATLPHAMPM